MVKRVSRIGSAFRGPTDQRGLGENPSTRLFNIYSQLFVTIHRVHHRQPRWYHGSTRRRGPYVRTHPGVQGLHLRRQIGEVIVAITGLDTLHCFAAI